MPSGPLPVRPTCLLQGSFRRKTNPRGVLGRPQPWRIFRRVVGAQETPARVEDRRECPQPARVRPAANAGQGLPSAIGAPPLPLQRTRHLECSFPEFGNRSCGARLIEERRFGTFNPSIPSILSSAQTVSKTQFSPKDQQDICPLLFSARGLCLDHKERGFQHQSNPKP